MITYFSLNCENGIIDLNKQAIWTLDVLDIYSYLQNYIKSSWLEKKI